MTELLIAQLLAGGPAAVNLKVVASLPATFDSQFRFWMVPALLVHLWLPFFAIGMLGVRAIRSLLSLVGTAQWAMKGGGQHPLQAAGAVAALLVFAGSGLARIVEWCWR
jgi:hypothetical protein